MRGKWIQEPESDAAVIFVHGILSSGEDAWLHKNGIYWPHLLKGHVDKKTDIDFASLGIYVFTYRSDIFSGNYRLSDAVDALKEHMRLDGLFENRSLIFVCHSMGGIVVRRFLVTQTNGLGGTEFPDRSFSRCFTVIGFKVRKFNFCPCKGFRKFPG